MGQKSLSLLDAQRAANLRQHLLRSARVINLAIVDGLHERGFTDLRSTHTALLSNLDLEGSNLTTVARRAGMTKQAMGRLADELIRLGYVKRTPDSTDARAVKLLFTVTGLRLMEHSFAVMQDIERRCAERLGESRFNMTLKSLQDIVIEFERG